MFFDEYDPNRYQKVVEACCLTDDFNSFPLHDETVLNQKGSNLSGGQKQRISLARAVYRQADVYIFDDPLSAIDPNLTQKIFDNVFSNETGYLKTKVILVCYKYMSGF